MNNISAGLWCSRW